jgi:Zn-dependent protease
VELDSTTVILLASLIPSVILHEVAHGVVALRLGDDTARRAGRLTLNPVKHVDPFGTLLLPAMLALSGLGILGYAKPVPVDVRRLRHPRNDSVWVALAGPGTNIVLSVLAALVYRAFEPEGTAGDVVLLFGVVNVILAAFNLIPLPPLDGSALVERVLPRSWWSQYLRLRKYSMLLVLAVVILVPGVLGGFLDWAIDQWARLL